MSTIEIQTNNLSLTQNQSKDTSLFNYLLQKMNLSISQLTPGFFLSMKAKIISEHLWEELFIALDTELDNKLIGYDLGTLVDMKHLGTFGKIILNSDSFESALSHIVKYVNVSNDVVMLKLDAHKEGAMLTIEPNSFSRKNFPVSSKQFSLMLLGAIEGVFGLMIQSNLKPLQYSLPYYLKGEPEIEEMFEGDIIYSENTRISILLSHQTLQAKSLRSNPILLENLLSQSTAYRFGNIKKWSHKVEQMLLHRYAVANVGLFTIAIELGLSEHTLKQYILEEKTSFKEIKEKVRLKLAKFTLIRTQDVDETAQFLGFTCPISFNKSFNRWSGQSAWSFLESA